MKNLRPKLFWLMSGHATTLLVLLVMMPGVSGCGANRMTCSNAQAIARSPHIFPDCHGVVLPPNIAPLNFFIREEGDRFFVAVSGNGKICIKIASSTPRIIFPFGKWKRLLSDCRGGILTLDVYCHVNNGWLHYKSMQDTIARDGIDGYIAYRKIDNCLHWKYMGIYERRLQDFDEKIVFHNKISGDCFHCHDFRNNNAAYMTLQIRSKIHGTPMFLGRPVQGKTGLSAVRLKTEFSHGRAGFTSWHPQKNLIAFSLNNYRMLMHTAAVETRDVFDSASDVAVYDIDKNEVSTCGSNLARNDRIETSPEWSKDGQYLYFCSAPQLPPERFREVRCDLMRIAFNPATAAWGRLDTVLTAREAGGSIVQPRFSPDGRFCLVTISGYGDFPIDKAVSALWIIDMKSMVRKKLEATGPWAEGWHCWSSNGQWIAFSSKGSNGKFSRIFISHIDTSGTAHKPFPLPQKDPLFYESCDVLYNKPELTTTGIPYSPRRLQALLDGCEADQGTDAVTAASRRWSEY
jgi:hypothetical protein